MRESRSFPSAAAIVAAVTSIAGCSGTIDPPSGHESKGGLQFAVSTAPQIAPPTASGTAATAAPGTPLSPVDGPVRVWLQQPQTDVEARILRDACDIWGPVGFSCELTDDFAAALIHVYVSEADCVDEDGDGSVVLATTYDTWDIVVEGKCLGRSWGGDPDERALRVLLAHETGHVLGLPHVIKDCQDPNVRLHVSGARICGDAVLNPMLNPVADAMTGADWLNWEMRNPMVGLKFTDGIACIMTAPVPDGGP